LLRLQSAAEPTQTQLEAEAAVLNRISIAYRRYRPSVVPIIWQQRLRTRAYTWGGRGSYVFTLSIYIAQQILGGASLFLT